ncbi:oxidoreductase FixC [Salmonella enterica subsp. enterica]|uniref:Protein FixC n=1 Tax=Salmonella enterica I TaxID=59201 RepID=A0A447U4B2_SALET|nr:oxidoreductase FixC [Salmonella enterica subsp. enterica]
MSDDKFDAIVVGAGVAGTVAAYVMAKAGLDVLVIERGKQRGQQKYDRWPALRSQYRKYYAGIRNVRPHRTRRYP